MGGDCKILLNFCILLGVSVVSILTSFLFCWGLLVKGSKFVTSLAIPGFNFNFDFGILGRVGLGAVGEGGIWRVWAGGYFSCWGLAGRLAVH